MADSKQLSFSIPPILMKLFRGLPLWTTARLHGKKLKNATKIINPKLGDNESDKHSSPKKVKKQNTKVATLSLKYFYILKYYWPIVCHC